ncbi:hypothetical protein EHS13_03085 [Paenibacillus psychroresistens]|uniref:Uncharacterized protein n=1 Tax=Paenibacillus psychroresistens TaxID=1778678 RepID=A0A6B8RCQ2_9BACL|nr:hypothetical protein [Paenibacillus psychroresistens]QGQ93960.1 hypothetical protein EHS13_03085 [Paenibacillus psychroresistens]
MSTQTNKLALLKPAGNEANTRANYNALIDQIDAVAMKDAFYCKSAVYNSGTSKIDVTIGSGTIVFLQTVVTKSADSVYSITTPAINTSYYVYLSNAGLFSSNTTGVEVDGAIMVWKVIVGSTLAAITLLDLRSIVSGSAQTVKDLLDAHSARVDNPHLTTAAQIGALPIGGGTLSGALILNSDPVSAFQAVTKQYVDAYALGLDTKVSVRAVAVTNIVLSGTQTIDGVVVIVGNRVLAVGQTTASQNGIYVVSAGAWTRSSDADTSAEVTSGMYTYIEEGTTFGKNGYSLITPDPIVLGTTSLTFSLFNGPGSVTVGVNLVKSGNQISLSPSVVLGGEMDAGAHTIGFTEFDNGNSGAAKTIDFRLSNKQKVAINASTVLTFTAPSKPCSLTLKLTYAGAFTVTLPSHKKPGGVALTFSSVNLAVDILSIYWDGTSYYIMNSLAWS